MASLHSLVVNREVGVRKVRANNRDIRSVLVGNYSLEYEFFSEEVKSGFACLALNHAEDTVYCSYFRDGGVRIGNLSTGKFTSELRRPHSTGGNTFVNVVAVSPQGLVYSGEGDAESMMGQVTHTSLIWKNNKLVATLEDESWSRTAQFSLDGSRLVCGLTSAVTVVRDTETFATTSTIQVNPNAAGGTDDYNCVNGVSFSPASKDLVVLGYRTGYCSFVDLRTPKQHSMLWCATKAKLNSTCFDESGGQILTSSRDSTVRLWDTRYVASHLARGKSSTSLDCVQSYHEHVDNQYNIPAMFMDGGRHVITGCETKHAYIYDTLSGKLVSKIGRPLPVHVIGVARDECGAQRVLLGSAKYSQLQVWTPGSYDDEQKPMPFDGHSDLDSPPEVIADYRYAHRLVTQWVSTISEQFAMRYSDDILRIFRNGVSDARTRHLNALGHTLRNDLGTNLVGLLDRTADLAHRNGQPFEIKLADLTRAVSEISERQSMREDGFARIITSLPGPLNGASVEIYPPVPYPEGYYDEEYDSEGEEDEHAPMVEEQG